MADALLLFIMCTEYLSTWKSDGALNACPRSLLPRSDESRSKVLEGSPQPSRQQSTPQPSYGYKYSYEQSSPYSSHQSQSQGKVHLFQSL